MYISNITLTNYRGVKEKREINLSRFSSIVGKNDAGKTIVLNAIASFLDVKSFAYLLPILMLLIIQLNWSSVLKVLILQNC
jgi:AAA15 family ATPase/GTPase